MRKARTTRTTRTTRTRRRTMKVMAIERSKRTLNLNVSKSYGERVTKVKLRVRRGEIETWLEKRTRFTNTRVRRKRLRGVGVNLTMLSQPRRSCSRIVDYLTQESSCFRGLVSLHDKIRIETGVQQVLDAYSTMGRALAQGGPPKLNEHFAGGELEEERVSRVSQLQLRRLDGMEILVAIQNRFCVDMGRVMAPGAAASPVELCQGVKKYYLGEGFQRWECSLQSPVYAW